MHRLAAINETLWDLEDEIRTVDPEKNPLLGLTIATVNDKRIEPKNQIAKLLNEVAEPKV